MEKNELEIWLNFISNMINAFVWPTIALVIVLILKDKITDLVPYLRKGF